MSQYHDEAVRLVASQSDYSEGIIRQIAAGKIPDEGISLAIHGCERRLEAEAISADLLTALKAVLAGKPVRCADELIAAAERFLEGK